MEKGSRPNLRNAIFPERGNIEGMTNVTPAIKDDLAERVQFLWALRSSPFVVNQGGWDLRAPFGGVDDITTMMERYPSMNAGNR